MKKLITLLSIALISTNMFASEKCTLNVKKYLVEPDCNRSTALKEKVVIAKNVEDCYEKALELSKEIPAISRYNGAIDAGFCKTYMGTITQYNYVAWNFNDGIISNSKGTVNAFTEKNSSQIEVGKNAYDLDGSLLP